MSSVSFVCLRNRRSGTANKVGNIGGHTVFRYPSSLYDFETLSEPFLDGFTRHVVRRLWDRKSHEKQGEIVIPGIARGLSEKENATRLERCSDKVQHPLRIGAMRESVRAGDRIPRLRSFAKGFRGLAAILNSPRSEDALIDHSGRGIDSAKDPFSLGMIRRIVPLDFAQELSRSATHVQKPQRFLDISVQELTHLVPGGAKRNALHPKPLVTVRPEVPIRETVYPVLRIA